MSFCKINLQTIYPWHEATCCPYLSHYNWHRLDAIHRYVTYRINIQRQKQFTVDTPGGQITPYFGLWDPGSLLVNVSHSIESAAHSNAYSNYISVIVVIDLFPIHMLRRIKCYLIFNEIIIDCSHNSEYHVLLPDTLKCFPNKTHFSLKSKANIRFISALHLVLTWYIQTCLHSWLICSDASTGEWSAGTKKLHMLLRGNMTKHI